MSFDSPQPGESNIFSLHSQFSSENLFSHPSNDLLKDTIVMQEVLLFRDTESEDLVTVADGVSTVTDDMDLGYDTNSVSSPLSSTKSHWGDPSTPSSSSGSFQEDELFADFDEGTRNSLISILDDDCSPSPWNQSDNAQTESPVSMSSSLDLSPGSPIVTQIRSATSGAVSLAAALQLSNLLKSSSEETDDVESPTRKRPAASLSTCGLSPRKRPKKFPSLIQALPEKQDGAELQILVQPEKHHRARYRTEGSRGSVKDDGGENYPKVKLVGVSEPVTLQVFVGIDQGKVRPHGYYQSCKVTGRNTTPCEEKDVDGTTILEVPWEPTNGIMELNVDCIGILKLRNADVEQRIGPIRSKRKSTCVRLVFRVLIPAADGSFTALQIASRSITCTQPLGQPEIVKKSLTKCSVTGGEELFIIGKNFTSKATTEVKLRQLDDDGKVAWEGDCDIDKTLFQNNHIVCTIPPYPNQNVRTPVKVFLVVTGKPNQCSELEAHPIEYIPNDDALAKHSPLAYNNVQDVVLPPTPTSPVSPLANQQQPITLLKVESHSPVVQQPEPVAVQPEEDVFALALQMLARTYVKNKDSYNSLLTQIQSQAQSPSQQSDSLQVLEVLENN